MTEITTRYDLVAYPAGLFPTTLPDHMAAIARLHGLDAAAPAKARVLEVAGGDGVNLIAMAAAWPDARFHSFDLSSAAVGRGATLVAAAGLDNVRVEVDDLLEVADRLDGPYDYVIVHGLYAWVPEPVREAALRLIGRVLAPEGVAFVSYNAQPGGHLRSAIRDMLLHHVGDIADPVERVGAARKVLEQFVAPREGDRPVVAALRQIAEPMLRKNAGSLYHDELSDCYAPQSLSQVAAAAEQHGLAFLNDAVPSMLYDGLPGKDLDDAAVVHAAQADDYVAASFFHQTLLVRPGRGPCRRIVSANVAGLLASSQATRTGEGSFAAGEDRFEIGDPRLADFIGLLGEVWPARLPLAGFADSLEHCEALVQLAHKTLIGFHAVPYPACLDPGERPRASPLARAQIASGATNLFTLDHRMVAFVEPGPRAFLSLLDGTRDRAQIAAAWEQSEFGGQVSVDEALSQFARAGMLIA
ncbi:methyltransferase domain-containing protein [Sphingomonas parva]|uniref:Methyltransferase domain-containing protein n=1 Tax=Sphingomonas parva TaxID=2555898 RepID=A0A4Y8ZT29_9SPHN|nr:class I SAM-dependent methyltransferase [Sphingomonas parva]TFI57616.1 methyltransferase domain-containing protein [Sphingomonas parva]